MSDEQAQGTSEATTDATTIDDKASTVDTTKQSTTTTTTAAEGTDTTSKDTKTIATGDTGEDVKTIQAKWPDNWREEMAGEDEASQKLLARFTTPAELVKKIREQDKLISSGGHKKAPSKEDPPEKWAAWRKANDIPEKPEEYDTKLPEGLVIGELDKPIVDSYLAVAHELNLSKEQVKQNLAWYFGEQERIGFEIQEKTAEQKKQSEDLLRQEWGGDYRMNLNMIPSVFQGAPEGLYEKIALARGPDGGVLGNDPDVNKWLVKMAREINPDAAVMPHVQGDRQQAIEDELAALTKESGNHQSDYWKGAKDDKGETKGQRRMRELIEAQEKMSRK